MVKGIQMVIPNLPTLLLPTFVYKEHQPINSCFISEQIAESLVVKGLEWLTPKLPTQLLPKFVYKPNKPTLDLL